MENLYKIYNNVSLAESMVTGLISKKGKVTKDAILEEIKISENACDSILGKLLSTNVIKICDDGEHYEYTTPLKGDIVVLDGDLMLPVSVINEDKTKIVSRGDKWYRFSSDFDLRRIVWNINLKNMGNSNNKTLVDLLTTQVVTEKSRGIKHISDYDHLVNKIVPYNKTIGILLNKIGEYLCDVSIIHKIVLSDGAVEQEIRKFRTHSEISTQELMLELNKELEDRDYENIRLEHCINIEDIILSGNEIPISYAKDKYGTEADTRTDKLKYVRIKKMTKEFVYDICVREMSGTVTTIDTMVYDSVSEGIESVIEMCSKFLEKLFRVNDFILDI